MKIAKELGQKTHEEMKLKCLWCIECGTPQPLPTLSFTRTYTLCTSSVIFTHAGIRFPNHSFLHSFTDKNRVTAFQGLESDKGLGSQGKHHRSIGFEVRVLHWKVSQMPGTWVSDRLEHVLGVLQSNGSVASFWQAHLPCFTRSRSRVTRLD